MYLNGLHLHWSEAADMVELIDRSLADYVEKADPNPLTKKGFDEWVDLYAQRVLRAARSGDQRAVKAMVKALDKPWANMTARRREALIKAAVSKIGLKASERVVVLDKIANNMRAAILATKKAAAKGLGGVGTTFDGIDKRVVAHTRKSQAHFIRDAYGRRQVALSAQARNIIADGLEKGFDSATIAETLSNRMATAGVLRSQVYWRAVSSIFMARGRSYGLMRSYDDAGIQYVKFDAIRDERTTEMCNFMHGKLIPVGKSLQRYTDVAESPDPEAVVDMQPFMQLGKNDKGDEVLYFKQGDQRVIVANVLEPARGKLDGEGSYRQRMNDDKLIDSGLGIPPIHGMCRSSTVPV